MSAHNCIWCLEPAYGKHEEHIIPEALGCPLGFVLPGTIVCQKCNNGLADLDQAVIDEFDFLTFMAGVPRKKGRPPAIRSRGNVLGSVEPNGPTMTFNSIWDRWLSLPMMDPGYRPTADLSEIFALGSQNKGK